MQRTAASLPGKRQSTPSRVPPRTGPALPRALGNLLVTGLLLAGGAHAQAKRCDLVGRDTTVSGSPTAFKRCLDLAALDGQTIAIPSNVTRIDNDGLSLCKGAVQAGGDLDIVYIYDNSGSMTPGYAYVNPATNDTTYYENRNNCADTSTSGRKVTFTFWNQNGTLFNQSRTLPRLNSNAGCTEYAGDPYSTRGRAYYLGIKDQAARAPQSTAGIMSFASTTGNRQSPLKLNAQANVDAVVGKIKVGSDGGTAYRPPIDTANVWLAAPVTANPKKAILFLSDGKPKDDSPAWTTPPAGTSPIYGIFLGHPRSDTLALYNMSKATGGKFYLIPPDDPDSLKSVVAAILNIVLLEYVPFSATVSNTSLAPAQTSSSSVSDFVKQADQSWLMQLSDIVGLKANAANVITVSTTFKEKASGTPDTKSVSFTLSTTLPPSSTTQKIGATQFGVACYDKSSLTILNGAGVRSAYFTDTNTAYEVRIRTAPVPLDSALASASSGAKGDAETPKLKPPFQSNADSLVFKSAFPFQVIGGTRTAGNGILESALFDSIIVAWTHPRDPQDFVADTVRVRAKSQNAQIWFSQSNGGSATASFPSGATAIYVVVKDQTPDPRKPYVATITSEAYSLDKETVTLSELTPGSGTLVGQIAISNAAKAPGDGKLEVSVIGDQLRATYKDPVDGDSAQATAGFDQAVQEAADLRFTDAAGNPLPPGTIWSPANGKLYFDYSDDDVDGNLPSKTLSLTLAGKKYGAVLAIDHERVTAAYAGNLTATRGHWKGAIDLVEGTPADSDGKAQTRFRGEATVTAAPHDNKGAAQNLTVSDNLVIAWPDSAASIQWRMDTTVAANEGMIFTVNDQSFTANAKDTVGVTVACMKSGDSVADFPAGEGPTAASGIYATGTLAKDEGTPSLGDRVLSCLTTDRIRVRYVDPVYGNLTELIIDEVARPVATPGGRKFTTSEIVTLTTATPGAAVWYTLDGAKPVPGKSLLYNDPIRVSVTSTLKAIAVKPGMKDSKILTETYTKEAVASRLEILDENGNAIPNGILAGSSKAIRIKLITTQDNLTSTDAPAATKVAGDAETVLLGFAGSLGNAIELSASVPLHSPAAKGLDNDTLEAAGTDTLVVRWENPFNPADKAADTLVIKPAFVAADVYFSATENGAKISEYPTNTDSVFIVVKTRPRDPALAYTVVLTSSTGSGDREVVPLTELSPGVFSGKAKVGTDAKAKGDQIIQVAAAGDQLTAVFTDPVYQDAYRGDAGFAQQVQESALLEFVDENGNALAPGDVWSPAKGKVYVRYSDDWNAGIDSLVKTKTARFALVNKRSGDSIGSDAETLDLALKSHTATRGTWEGFLPLQDKAAAAKGNGTLESYYRGELHAAVTPHDNAGAAVPGEAGDDLVIAYPDQPAEIIVRDTSGGAVERKTDRVSIVIRDQQMTQSGNATIKASATCSQTGDKLDAITLAWDGAQYVAKPTVAKDELNAGTPDKTDAILQCRDSDVLTVTYADPVYGDPRTAEVHWSDDPPGELYYASAKDGSRISSAVDGPDAAFVIVAKGKSPTRDKADTITVTLTTAQGESESFRAVETGAFTGEFRAQAPFRFQSGSPKAGDGTVEAALDAGQRINQIVVNGKATVGGAELKADLTLLSLFDLAAEGWAKDEDGDGRADHLYFRFDHALARLPAGLPEAYWNTAAADYKQKAAAAQIAFVPGRDSSVIVADFSKSPFGLGLTGIPEGKPAPYALFPDDNLFGAQKALLADSIGPIPVKAVKLPSDGRTYTVTATEKRFNPDTLLITVSEKLRTSTSFDALFRFSKGCKDYSESVPLKLFSLPEASSDGLTIKVVVDNSLETQTPFVDDCIFLETDGRYSDMDGNRPSKVGAPITGADPKLVIRAFKGYPPVAGIDAGSVGFTTANHDQLDAGTYRQEVGADRNVQVIWVPPVGYDPRDPVGSLERVARDFTNSSGGERTAEGSQIQPMPTDVSTVQVITSTAYLARITIFDNLGNFVRTMTQSFGHNGELRNRLRTVEGGQVSFLVWDMKDFKGAQVGQGVYVWKVSFTFQEANKKSEVRYTRTGVLRR